MARTRSPHACACSTLSSKVSGDTLTAPIGRARLSNVAAATQRMLRSFSSSSTANPRRRTRSSSRSIAGTVVSVLGVRRSGGRRARIPRTSAAGSSARIALPIAVRRSGMRPPTRDAVW